MMSAEPVEISKIDVDELPLRIRVADLANFFGCSKQTIYRRYDEGKLKGGGQPLMITRESVREFLETDFRKKS